jgi:hypothetical protein
MVLAVTLGFVAADWALARGRPAAREEGQAVPSQLAQRVPNTGE